MTAGTNFIVKRTVNLAGPSLLALGTNLAQNKMKGGVSRSPCLVLCRKSKQDSWPFWVENAVDHTINTQRPRRYDGMEIGGFYKRTREKRVISSVSVYFYIGASVGGKSEIVSRVRA